MGMFVENECQDMNNKNKQNFIKEAGITDTILTHSLVLAL